MLKHFLKVISFAYCLVLYAVIADAQLPQISSGLSYLASSQKKQEKGQVYIVHELKYSLIR